jgi:D-alanyl-D-alanine dipeptidase
MKILLTIVATFTLIGIGFLPKKGQKDLSMRPIHAAMPNPDTSGPAVPDKKSWTNIKDLDKTVALDIKYATSDNFTKAQIYDCPACYLRPAVAKAIVKIHNELKSKSYGGLKMFDCYRPRPYQQRLWDKVPDARYVTPPAKGSQHNRGAAVDLTIVDKNGKDLDMGTPYDFFGERAYHTFTGLPPAIQANRTLLKTTLERHGFRSIRTEWWHYSYKGKAFPLESWLWPCP